MSIASEITRISGNVADAYTAANAKGATMPVTQNSDNLATTISTIQTGTTPTGTKSITANGVYDVTDFASADVQVPTTAPAYYVEKTVDANGKLYNGGSNIISFSGVTDIGNAALYSAYEGNTNISGALDLSSIKKISGGNALCRAFESTGITSLNFNGLETITGSGCLNATFQNCHSLTSISFDNINYMNNAASCFGSCDYLTSVNMPCVLCFNNSNSFFRSCSRLVNIDLGSVIVITNYSWQQMFYDCTSLASINISKVTKIATNSALNSAFENCTSLTTLSFNGLAYNTTNFNNTFQNMLKGVTGCTVHFPAEWETTMQSWSNVTAGFGGTNTTVLFDLPNVTTLDWSHIIKINSNNVLGSFAQNNYFPNVTKVDLSNLKILNGAGQNAFSNCTSLTSFDLSKLQEVNANCASFFAGCSGLTSANLSCLTKITATSGCLRWFEGCNSITSANLNSLKIISALSGCAVMFSSTALTELRFPALKTVYNKDVFSNIVANTTGCTVHFPSNFATTVTASDVGGTNTTVLYDLPAVVVLTGADTVEYERNPKYDSATALAWRVNGTEPDTTTYYTSGLTDPTVGTTIYSDSACTVTETTVDSIV